MIVLVGLHLVVGLVIVGLGERLARRAIPIAAVLPLATVVWIAVWSARGGDTATESLAWAPNLGLTVDLRLDGLAAIMVLLIAGLGVGVVAYGWRYFPPRRDGLGRLIGLLLVFSGSMLGLVLADNLLLLVTFWELTAITSFLLIGNDHTTSAARAAALQAILTTGLGGLAMLGGMILLGNAAGTYRLSELLSAPPTGAAVTAGLMLVLVGAASKSAQYPFHSWLPAAMVAPTPVSAYLHSATMVKAGVYLVARFALPFADATAWRPTVVTIGLVTMLAGGLRALRQTDLKALLAFGTISQLGFMFVLFGIGTPESVQAGCVLLLAHGLFKAALFMGVGIIDHQTGTRDLAELGSLDRGWGGVRACMTIAAASMAGIPLALGFIAKESAYDAVWHRAVDGGPFDRLVLVGVVVGSMITFAYSARLLWGTFVAPGRRHAASQAEVAPSRSFVAPVAVAVGLTLVLGLVPGVLDGLVGRSSGTDAHLSIWHGLTAALWLSLGTYAAGALLFSSLGRLARVLATGALLPSGTRTYRSILRNVNRLADRVTGTVQSGSLPVYAGVVLLTAAALPAWALLDGAPMPDLPTFVDGAGQVALAALIIGSAIGAAVVRRRFAAALFLGMAGYGMAGLFVVQGAPDLALTQTAIETLTTVLFVLVLRRLPDRFERTSAIAGRSVRVAVAVFVGVVVFVFALVAGGERVGPPVSDEMVDRALPDGNGRNVVNVILVDFRGFDTLGEITVLAAAAIGAVALARAGRRPGSAVGDAGSGVASAAEEPSSAGTPAPEVHVIRRVFNVDQSVSVIFYVMMMASLYLLFAGHNQPGGGFVGGLVAGAAIALRYVAGGIDEVRRVSPLKPWTILGGGVVLAVLTALTPVLWGHPVLDNGKISAHPVGIGDIKVTSAIVFDLGVYLVVIGLVLMVVEAFGERFSALSGSAGSSGSTGSSRSEEHA